MREAARALDGVSDHLGEVLRRADELLAEWSRFGAQVRAQVEREVATVGDVVDGAVARAAGSGIDRAVADRLRALTAELERLEQRTRAASRAVVEQREADRRVLWIVVAGVVLANALLVVLLLRKPEPAPVADPIRIEAPTAPATTEPAGAPPAAGSADAITPGGGSAQAAPAAGSNAATSAATPAAGASGSAANAPGANPPAANNAASAGATRGPAVPAAPAKATPHGGAAKTPDAGAAKPTLSPIALPPKSNARPHKKQP